MTKEYFNKLLNEKDISWNDKVNITIYNPFKKWYKFNEPKLLNFTAYILYTDEDEVVWFSVIDEDDKLIDLYFDFYEIKNIQKITKI